MLRYVVWWTISFKSIKINDRLSMQPMYHCGGYILWCVESEINKMMIRNPSVFGKSKIVCQMKIIKNLGSETNLCGQNICSNSTIEALKQYLLNLFWCLYCRL